MSVRSFAILGALALVLSGCGTGRQAAATDAFEWLDYPSAIRAQAGLVDAQGRSHGLVQFSDIRQGVRVDVSVIGLPPGKHGFHVHSVGKCDPPDFASAGGHFNPNATKHGLENREGPHAGDLPNLVVGDDGKAKTFFVNVFLSLNPAASNSLLKPGGAAIVVHADPDDGKTDPAGNSGNRIACGVITRVGS